MKAFLAALVFYTLVMAVTGLVFEYAVSDTVTDRYALGSARVDGHAPADGRLGWAAER